MSPGVPVVGERATIVVEAPIPKAPSTLAVELVSPTDARMQLLLKRIGRHLWRGTYHFPDDGSWALRVRARGVTASDEVLVLQNGALAPLPKILLVPGLSGLDGLFGSNGALVTPHAR